ncbi:unnamed protein product [Lasius platythorax]|uniref:Uncharacterized protein n=1 Tax=Lasius platythorax TaxID=488582 RepID=A0AAV2MVD4_9HYME
MFTLGENVSNSVSTNEKDSGLNKREVSIEIVNSAPYIPVAVDMDVDISNLEIVLLPEENENSLTLETETLNTAEAHINNANVCDSTCAYVKPIEDFGQHDFFESF